MKFKALFVLLLLVTASTHGICSDTISVDSPRLTFDSVKLNFGQIELGEDLVFELKFKNTGNEALYIETCSCRGLCNAEYPKEVIYPRQQGSIKVQHPNNVLGYGTHKILLIAYPVDDTIWQDPDYQEIYYSIDVVIPKNNSVIQFLESSIDFGTTECDQSKKFRRFIKYINLGTDSLALFSAELKNYRYEFDIVEVNKKPLAPGKIDSFEIRQVPSLFGNFETDIIVKSNAANGYVSIPLTAHVSAPGKCPILTFETLVIDIGNVVHNPDTTVTFVFKFTNTGAADLIIISALHSGGPGVAEGPKEPIPPGGHGEVVGYYWLSNAGQFSKNISVGSNAGNGAIMLTTKGNIIPK